MDCFITVVLKVIGGVIATYTVRLLDKLVTIVKHKNNRHKSK